MDTNIRRPEPRGEGVPEIMKVEIADRGGFDCLFETDHQLTTFPPRSVRVKDALFIGRVLPQALQDFKCPDSQRYKTGFIVDARGFDQGASPNQRKGCYVRFPTFA